MLTLTLAVLLHAAPDAGAVPTNPATVAQMRGLYGALLGLEPYLAKPSSLASKKNEAAFLASLDALSRLEHVFPADPSAQEPATAALSSLFSQYAQATRRAFVEGDRSSVHLRVRTLVSLCFTCHSRERAAQDFADAAKAVDALTLDPLERAQYLAATRQFDKALAAYRVVLDAPIGDERALLEHSRALRDAMAIHVRVKDDARGAQALLDAEAPRKDVPPFLRDTVTAWRADVAAWQKERFDVTRATPPALFQKAKALVTKSDGVPGFLSDERNDVKLLRASGYLNLALGKDPKLKQRGEALYLLGLSAAGLKSPLLWEVDQLFFEACIRENPHTAQARTCFEQLSDRLYFGYTGSAGTNVPQDELDRLAGLRALAEPAPKR